VLAELFDHTESIGPATLVPFTATGLKFIDPTVDAPTVEVPLLDSVTSEALRDPELVTENRGLVPALSDAPAKIVTAPDEELAMRPV
jgi:hypothetical protein